MYIYFYFYFNMARFVITVSLIFVEIKHITFTFSLANIWAQVLITHV